MASSSAQTSIAGSPADIWPVEAGATALPPSDELAASASSQRRSFVYFCFYRLAVATVIPAAALFFGPSWLASPNAQLFYVVAATYWAVALLFVLTLRQRWLSFKQILTVQVLADILALTVLLHAGGGPHSGLTLLIVVVLAGAGLVGQGRLAVFYAAVATLALLAEEGYRALSGGVEGEDFLVVGTTSIGFFAIAISAQLLAQRVLANEALARSRGVALSDQIRVNEQIIRDMDDGVLVVDAGGIVRQSNPQAERLLGASVGRNVRLDQVNPQLAEAFGQVTGAGRDESGSRDISLGQRDIRVRVLRPTSDGDALLYLQDLSAAKAHAQQLKLAALGRLTASVAHEVRNPLAAISHAAELLREEKRGDMQSRLIRIIHDNSRRLDRMVKEILELGRRDRAEPELIQLAKFLETFVDEFCMHEGVGGDLFRVSADGGLKIAFDRAHLNQVLWNLLANAVRHGSGQPGSITLSAARSGLDGHVDLHIIDDGKGVPDDARGRVFEPFFTTDPKGTGLGLYIARELCDANHATLELAPNSPGGHFCMCARTNRRT